ncbi:putative Eukaryotic translation initiation factor 3 subunit A [Hibiscus syriacus]|uniref:Eukaryotic translation initiation factor 3 subunit A n=1 Tax=Hibiscus syriacus TaxID=106335 RepID=A0A6A2Y4W3_HIBSY|nr:putative Eukaryotic translation initiation factor 3 subunit A [Hibiscus syriacus]
MLLQLPHAQQALDQEQQRKWVEQLLDGSLMLLDVCGTAKDALLQTKESTQELRSILRRRQGVEGLARTNLAALPSAKMGQRLNRNRADGNTKQVENVQNELQNSEMCILDLDDGLESLFRRLIKARVTVLNSLNC